MPSYEELKAELDVIAKIVERFPEGIKAKVFELLTGTFLGHSTTPVANSAERPADVRPPGASKRLGSRTKKRNAPANAETPASGTKKSSSKGSSKESYAIDRELNLRGDKSIPSFKTFVEEKKPGSAKEFNAVAVYYLQKMLGSQKISLDHAYTCYVEAGRRPPEAFKQSFTDTKNKEGWIEFDGEGFKEITKIPWYE